MWIKNKQLELDMKQRTGSKLGKEYIKTVHCHPAYLTCMNKVNGGLNEAQAGIKIAGRIGQLYAKKSNRTIFSHLIQK